MHHRGKSVRMGLTPSDVNIKKNSHCVENTGTEDWQNLNLVWFLIFIDQFKDSFDHILYI